MPKRNMPWSPARLVSLVMVIIPILVMVAVVANLVWVSLPVYKLVGLKMLFSTKFSNVFSGLYTPGEYGLLPALWGTVLVAILALFMAFPVSMAMAVFASEFSLGGLGGWMEIVLSVLSGIPPIIYSILSIFILNVFVRPKFAGEGLTDAFIKALPGLPQFNEGMLPKEQCTLLGGIMLALLIIPFMAPLILDAIRGVPLGQKEASLALGATRWHTLTHVTLPAALSGIVAAVSVGTLKTIGDVVISAWTIGYTKESMPAPLWDIFERSAPLTSTAAGLISGLKPGVIGPQGLDRQVAYFAGLLLLALAFLILGLVSLVQTYLHRRFAR